jgi:hypothetical protein
LAYSSINIVDLSSKSFRKYPTQLITRIAGISLARVIVVVDWRVGYLTIFGNCKTLLPKKLQVMQLQKRLHELRAGREYAFIVGQLF